MFVVVPDWVSHNGQAIFSIDVNPDGVRLATGGQDCKIKIWNMAPLQSVDAERNSDVHKMLAVMTSHIGAVNCVRWHPKGALLASGSDDKLVMLWQMSQTGAVSAPFGSSPSEATTEQWRCTGVLHGHEGDVCDLAWSADGSRLATCGIDRLVIVWDPKTSAVIARLQEHSSFVKGVTWDPAGQFLASQSEDLTMRIWRTKDWKVEAVVKRPFEPTYANPFDANLFFRRPSWSPDGAVISTAHAYNENESTPVSALVDRDTWATNVQFVGHSAPIIATRFNPVIFQPASSRGDVDDTIGVCAVGTQDGALSVWSTASNRAIAVAKHLFTRPVLDLTWDRSGIKLLACSGDGSIALVQFSEDEIGRPISASKTERKRKEAYGVHMGDEARVFVPEDPRYLKNARAPPPATSFGAVAGAFGGGGGGSLHAQTSIAQPPRMAVSESPNRGQPPSQQQQQPQPQPVRASNVAVQQVESRTRDGKRRIQPTFLGESGNGASAPVNSAFTGDVSQSNATATAFQKLSFSPAQQLPFVAPPQPSQSAVVAQPLTTSANNNTQHAQERDERPSKRKASVVVDGEGGPAPKRPAVAAKDSVGQTQQPPPPQPQLPLPAMQVTLGGSDAPATALETAQVNASLYKLTCLHDGAPAWDALLPARPQRLDGSASLVAVVCEDGTLLTFSETGRRLLPPLFVGSPCKWLSVSDGKVLVIGGDDSVRVWEPRRSACTLCERSFGAILAQQPLGTGVSVAFLSKRPPPTATDGSQQPQEPTAERPVPVVRLTNDVVFAFDHNLSAWVRIASRGCPIAGASEYAALPGAQGLASGPLATMQSGLVMDMRGSIGALRTANAAPTTLAHLEMQVVAAKAVGSPVEWEYWLHAYARRLADELHIARLRDLFEDLLGARAAEEGRDEPPMPIERRLQIVRALVPVVESRVRERLELQRFVSEVQETVEELE
eukprot:Opistho-1_new@87080